MKKEKLGLWLVDVQEKLFPLVDRHHQVLERLCFALEAFQMLGLEIFVTEQYPQGLGETIAALQERLPEGQLIHSKTTFSGLADPKVAASVEATGVTTWILVGVEAHVCILQTAKDLLKSGKKVIILNDAVSSRSIFDFSTGIGELRDSGCRISSTETMIYEIIGDASSPEFKKVLPLVKAAAHV